jgi:hypothetical protein
MLEVDLAVGPVGRIIYNEDLLDAWRARDFSIGHAYANDTIVEITGATGWIIKECLNCDSGSTVGILPIPPHILASAKLATVYFMTLTY